MKQLLPILLTLVLLQCTSLSSQIYQPLGVEDATWIFKGYGELESTAWAYKISGNTIVNNQQYKNLYHVKLTVQFNPGEPKDFLIADTQLFGLIRDDIQNKKVYIRYLDNYILGNSVSDSCQKQATSSADEILLIDFNKKLGDNFSDCMSTYEANEPILTDTTLFIYGANRRSLSLRENDTDPDKITGLIEGIGYTSGLFQDFGLIYHAGKGIQFTYCVGPNIDCGLLSASEEILRQSELKIYPNPTYNELSIESPYRMVQADILNSSGQLIGSDSDWNGLQSVNVSHYPPGIYFIILQTKDNTVSRRRFVKY